MPSRKGYACHAPRISYELSLISLYFDTTVPRISKNTDGGIDSQHERYCQRGRRL